MDTQKSALFTRDFSLVVIGQIISLFGNAILHFALPLYLLRETTPYRKIRSGKTLPSPQSNPRPAAQSRTAG